MAKVTVACKLPVGLTLDLATGPVTLNGFHHASSVGGYGLTPNVDADAFDKWLKDHKDYTPVANGLIFAHAKQDMVAAEAAERTNVRSGFEQIKPQKGGKVQAVEEGSEKPDPEAAAAYAAKAHGKSRPRAGATAPPLSTTADTPQDGDE